MDNINENILQALGGISRLSESTLNFIAQIMGKVDMLEKSFREGRNDDEITNQIDDLQKDLTKLIRLHTETNYDGVVKKINLLVEQQEELLDKFNKAVKDGINDDVAKKFDDIVTKAIKKCSDEESELATQNKRFWANKGFAVILGIIAISPILLTTFTNSGAKQASNTAIVQAVSNGVEITDLRKQLDEIKSLIREKK